MTEVWDLRNQREKRKSTCHVFVAEELSRDLHDFEVELDTELPTMMNIVGDDDNGCEAKAYSIGKRSKVKTCI